MRALPQRPVALLLDFDGVVVQSVKLKIDAFLEIYAGEDPRKLAAVLEHQRAHGGVTRRAKFRHLERHVFGRDVDDERIEALSRRYTELVHDAVLACPYVPGALDFLRRVHGKADMHVISGTPVEELADIVRRRDLARYFASVHGAPETKAEAFAAIIARYGYEPARVLAIGDATTERDAAAEAGVAFLAIVPTGEPSLFAAGTPTVATLEGLAEALGFMRAAPGLRRRRRASGER
jgi:phosphoglycolate phosphatase-like HAD superfamily hydrolase